MIQSAYSRMILNALFKTGGSVGATADQEREQLIYNGTVTSITKKGNEPVTGIYGRGLEDYALAYVVDGYTKDGPTMKTLDSKQKRVLSTKWWDVVTYMDSTTIQVPIKDSEGTIIRQEERLVYFTCWEIVQKEQQCNTYPSNSFLALFTQMPDENGSNYTEPDSTTTTYMRVNLHQAIITGNESLNKSTKNQETGVSIIDNKEIIMFPEISGSDWGNIIGFGIFGNEEVGSGVPILWGRLNNENGITASIDHVPLFRIGEFQVFLQ